MLYEILTTSSLLAISGAAYYFQNINSNSDHEKIKRIADEAGLKTKEGGIRIYRKQRGEGYTEYVYKMPLGLSFKQFEEKKELFVDGLNNKSRPDLNLKNLKNIDWKGDVIKQIKDILNNRIKLDKQLEIEYDGMLKFKIYEKGFSMMQKAGLGYLLVMIAPMILDVLVDAMDGVVR